jgi:hypothetical protein
MRAYRTVQATLIVAFGTVLVAGVAAPVLAQVAPDQAGRQPARGPAAARAGAPAKKSVEIEVHGGFAGSSQARKGTGALPAAGTAFTTVNGTPTRSIPSWYFGDGTKLFNDFNKNVGFPTNVITPLDTALNAAATSRKSGASVGAGVAYPLNDRIALEGTVDIISSHLAIGSGALGVVAGSVSSFKSAFTTGLTGAPGLSVTSTSAIVDTQGREMFATGGLRINLLARGPVVPFVTVGGGLVHRSGKDTVQLVGNYQFMSCGGVCPKSETDTVNVAYSGKANSPVMGFGGGVKGAASAKIGWRIDARVYVSKNVDTTTLTANPTVAPAAAAVQSALAFGGSPDLQFSTIPGIKSSLSGSASGFNSFTGSGMRTQAAVTGGITFRF